MPKSTLPTYSQLISEEKSLEVKKVLLISGDRKVRSDFQNKVRNFLVDLARRINELQSGQKLDELSKIFQKWEERLGDNQISLVPAKYMPYIADFAAPLSIDVLAEDFNPPNSQWRSTVKSLVLYAEQEGKLHPEFIRPTSSQNPEIAQIIESMYIRDK